MTKPIDKDSTPAELEARRNEPVLFDWYCLKCKLPLVDQECGGKSDGVNPGCPICDSAVTDAVMLTDE